MPLVFEWQMLAGKAVDRCYMTGREDSGPIDAVLILSGRVNWLPSVGHGPADPRRGQQDGTENARHESWSAQTELSISSGLISRRKLFRGRAQSPNRRAYPGRCGVGEKSHLP